MMARHGMFHSALGRAHHSNQTPHIAVTLAALITFLVPCVLAMFGLEAFTIMGYMGTICTYGFLLVYILVSIAAPVYLYRLGNCVPWISCSQFWPWGL